MQGLRLQVIMRILAIQCPAAAAQLFADEHSYGMMDAQAGHERCPGQDFTSCVMYDRILSNQLCAKP